MANVTVIAQVDTFMTAASQVAMNAALGFTTTASQTYTFPITSATIARTDAANTFMGVQTMTSAALTTPVIAGGLTASGSGANDFSGSTGTFITSTGANTLSGATTINDATTPSLTTAAGKTNTGFVQVNGKTSGALKLLPADATAQTITLATAAQTTGAATVTIPDMAGSSDTLVFLAQGQTLTNKRVTIRTNTVASSATPTINTDTTDEFTITALATAVTSFTTNLSGTPVNGDMLMIRIKDNGTARALAWGASFRQCGASLPTTTVISKTLYVLFIYNSAVPIWDCVSTSQET
jgi:hypothetical protein